LTKTDKLGTLEECVEYVVIIRTITMTPITSSIT